MRRLSAMRRATNRESANSGCEENVAKSALRLSIPVA